MSGRRRIPREAHASIAESLDGETLLNLAAQLQCEIARRESTGADLARAFCTEAHLREGWQILTLSVLVRDERVAMSVSEVLKGASDEAVAAIVEGEGGARISAGAPVGRRHDA